MYLSIICEILNAVKHVKGPLWCLTHSRCSRNTGLLPFWRWCQQSWSSPSWCVSGSRRRGPVFVCWLPPPSSLCSWHGFYGDKGPLAILPPEHYQDLPLPSWQVAVAMLSPGVAGNRSPWPGLMWLPWILLSAWGRGGWPALAMLCGSAVVQLGCSSRIITPASPSSVAFSLLVF